MSDQIRLRAVGSSIWVTGDDSPFWVSEPPDIAIKKIEDSLEKDERFCVLTGHHFKRSENGGDQEVAQRSFYLRPTMVVAVSQRLMEEDEDDDD